MSWSELCMLGALVVTLPAITACSSADTEQVEQSKAQSDVLGEHFKARRPEAINKK